MNWYKKSQHKPTDDNLKHIVGNAVFAIETGLGPLKKRISDGRTEEALAIVDSIERSLDKIKGFVLSNG